MRTGRGFVQAAAALLLATLLLLQPLLQPQQAYALSCAEIPSGEDAYSKYDAVVVAEVKSVKSEGRSSANNQVELLLLQSFKGLQQEKVTVREDKTWGPLNGPSEVGKQYLMYLRQLPDGWVHSLCTPSKLAANAGAELSAWKDRELAIPAGQSVQAAQTGASDASAATRLIVTIGIVVCVVALVVILVVFMRRTRKRM